MARVGVRVHRGEVGCSGMRRRGRGMVVGFGVGRWWCSSELICQYLETVLFVTLKEEESATGCHVVG